MFSRYLTVEEALAVIFDSEQSCDGATVAIDPPDDGNITEEDSGDEEMATTDNFSGRQLSAPVSVKLMQDGERRNLDSDSDDEAPLPPQPGPSKRGRRARAARTSRESRDWERECDLSPEDARRLDWPGEIPEPSFTRDLSPAAFFELFFDDAVYEILVSETVRYARQQGNHSFSVDVQAMRRFIAILIISGYNTVPRRRLYWSNSPDVRNDAMCAAMSRKMFEDILRYLHVAKNEQLNKDDKFAKLRPLFDAVDQRFRQHFPVQQHLAIDESMVPYFGKHSTKQFIRGKPIRFGYKLWCCCTKAGCLVSFEPYQGASGRTETTALGVGGGVVVRLLERIPSHPYTVFTDNFFTSLMLIDELKKKGIGLTGTVRANRVEKCPLQAVDQFKKLDRGSTQFFPRSELWCSRDTLE